MIITKHISLDNECVEKIKPYVEKHSSNFSAAVREIIEKAGKSGFPANSSALDSTLFKWMLSELDGILLPDAVLEEIIDRSLMKSMGQLERYLNNRFRELDWGINLTLKCDNDSSPSDVLIELKGTNQKIKFAASLLSQYLVKNSLEGSPLEIRSVVNISDCIRVEMSRSNKKEALNSLYKFFGGKDEVINAVKSRLDFWKSIISRHALSNYNMVTVHRNYFEDLLSGKAPMGEIAIEYMSKKPIHEIPLKEMLSHLKEVYETSRVVDRVEINNDTIVLFHNYRNNEAIERLKKSLIALLETNGHVYDAKSTANMIVLTHRPDIGIKINEIVENLKNSSSRLDQELVVFMAFLKEVKSSPDVPLSLTSLGARIGKSLMHEYEHENNVKSWNLENFKTALELIDSKLHRKSEWKIEGKNLLYTIRKCGIATEGNTFDTYVCHTAREVFKGALNYAFGNRAELEIKKLLTHGDNCCEVLIRIL